MNEAQALETLKNIIHISRVGDDESAPVVIDGYVGVDANLNREQLLALLFFLDKETAVSEELKMVTPGIYKHYKRGRFVVLGVAKNCKTEEQAVVFHAEDDMSQMWMRPPAEFLSTEVVDGVEVARFTLLEPKL